MTVEAGALVGGGAPVVAVGMVSTAAGEGVLVVVATLARRGVDVVGTGRTIGVVEVVDVSLVTAASDRALTKRKAPTATATTRTDMTAAATARSPEFLSRREARLPTTG